MLIETAVPTMMPEWFVWMKSISEIVVASAATIGACATSFKRGRLWLTGWLKDLICKEITDANDKQLQIFNGRYLDPVRKLEKAFDERKYFLESKFTDIEKRLEFISMNAANNAAEAIKADKRHGH